MFQNLRPGNIFYIVERDKVPTVKTGQVLKTSSPMPVYGSGYQPQYEMTVRAKVGDNEGDFAHLPASGDTHDYGNMIVASNREALLGVIDNIEQVADGELSRTEQNKATKAACVEIRKSLNPSYAKEQERDEAISNLSGRLDGIENSMAEVLKLLNKK